MNMRGISRMSAFLSLTLVMNLTGCLSKRTKYSTPYYTPYKPNGWTITSEPLDEHLKQPLRWGVYPSNEALVLENETLRVALALWPVSRSVHLWMLTKSPLLLRMNVIAKQNVEISCDKIHLSVPFNTTNKISPESLKINGAQQEFDAMLHLSPGEEADLHISYAYPCLFHNEQVFFLLIEGVYTNNSMVNMPIIRLNHVDTALW